MSDSIYFDQAKTLRVEEKDYPLFANFLKKSYKSFSKMGMYIYDENGFGIKLYDLLGHLSMALHMRLLFNNVLWELPPGEQTTKLLDDFVRLNWATTPRYFPTKLLSQGLRGTLREKIMVPVLRLIATKPKYLLKPVSQDKTSSVTLHDSTIPVRNYKEAAWFLLALVGAERGLKVEADYTKKTCTYTLDETCIPKAPSADQMKKRNILSIANKWCSCIPGDALYYEYWKTVLKKKENLWPEKLGPIGDSLKEIKAMVPSYILSGSLPLNLGYLLEEKETLATCEEEVIKSLQYNVKKLQEAISFIEETFPKSRVQMHEEILTVIYADAMNYAVGSEAVKKELAILSLEGYSLEISKAVINKVKKERY